MQHLLAVQGVAVHVQHDDFRPQLFRQGHGAHGIAGIGYDGVFLLLFEQGAQAGADVVFGLWLANRSHAVDGLADAAAPTVNLVPLRVRAALAKDAFEVAAQVQADLREIGSVENAGTGLWEVGAWTGVRVDSFVNFLKLPEGEDGEKTRAQLGRWRLGGASRSR